MAQIDTLVLGNPGSCRAAATWLKQVGTAAKGAADTAQGARMTASGGWGGPAAEAFFRAAKNPLDTCDDISLTSGQYAAGLEEFADCVDRLIERMAGVVAKAQGGGLQVVRGFIMSPDASTLGVRPVKPAIQIEQPGSESALDRYQEQVDAYNLRVEEFNRKVALFNECGDLVKDIRVAEKQAHVNLRGDLAGDGDTSNWRIGDVPVGEIVDGREAYRDGRKAMLLERIRELTDDGNRYTTIASADKPDFLDRRMLEWYQRAAEGTRADKQHLLTMLSRYENGRLPAESRTLKNAVPSGAGEYEGRRAGRGMPREATGAAHAYRVMNGFAKGVPLMGDIATGIDEFIDVARGRQTITAATIRTLGQFGAGVAGGFLGAAAGGAAGGAIGGYAGAGVGTAVGSVVGDWYFQDQADHQLQAFLEHAMPDEINPDQNQARAGTAQRIE